MKIEVTDISPVRKNLAVEVDVEEVSREREALLRHYARQAKIPGFRPGRAPLRLVEARLGADLDEELKERVVSRYYRQALREKGLEPLGEARLEEVAFQPGAPLRFRASIEVLPKLEPKNYRAVEVRRESPAVSVEEEERMLERLRQEHARFVSEEGREAQTGDLLVADIEREVEGGAPVRDEGVLLELGTAKPLPEFHQQLEGVQAGQTREFVLRYPREFEDPRFAGKAVRYRVAVREVKRRLLPELDDAFAKECGEFEDLAALRRHVRERLAAAKRAEIERRVRRAVLDKVLLENPIPLPEQLVEEELRHRLEEFARLLLAQGVDPRSVEVDWARLRAEQEPEARRAVHARLLLDAVARVEGLEVTEEEFAARLEREAQEIGESPARLRARLSQGGRLQAFRSQLVREKTLDFLVSVANILGEE